MSQEIAALQPVEKRPQLPFVVVGVGASAGGIAATCELLQGLGEARKLAVLIVQHQDRHRESELVQVLASHTTATVATAQDGLELQAGHVYVSPPDATVTVVRGSLRLAPRTTFAGLEHPIDRLFHSLAFEHAALVVGVVLSGTGTDGSLGIRAIEAAGGIGLAQDDSAVFTEMPHAAAATGSVDFVLPPRAIASELLRIAEHPEALQQELAEGAAFRNIVALLQRMRAMDFAGYKASTLRRRLQRRLFVRKVKSLAEYLGILEQDPAEVEVLAEEMLVHVTRFFRDPHVFEALRRHVFPQLLRAPRDEIRVWVPGCSTGEEVYSIAISLLEFLSEVGAAEVSVRLFGTDASKRAIATARSAHYSEGIEEDLSKSRLQQYFVPVDGAYKVRQFVRDLCVFSTHDVLRDPPFSRIDLVSCRNLMIYLGPALQERLLPVLHYALRKPGFLLLGSAETARGFAGFSAVDAEHKIYSRSALPEGTRRELAIRHLPDALARTTPTATISPDAEVSREADRAVLARLTVPGVVVDDALRIVQFRGKTGPYLEPAPGGPRFELLRMAREQLRSPLRQAIEQARTSHAPSRTTVRGAGDGPSAVDLEVVPLRTGSEARHFLVLFHELDSSAVAPTAEPATAEPDLVAQLRRDLQSTRNHLQTAIDELETANADLRAANEEVISSNEELRSTNDELETAKEELQASNQELVTVNDELTIRHGEITRLNDDLANVLRSVPVPVLVLDRESKVRRFTQAAGPLLGLTPGHLGRPVTEQLGPFGAHCAELAREVLEHQVVVERTVQDETGGWHLLAARPYLTVEGQLAGAILSILDIDAVTGTSFRDVLTGASQAVLMTEESGRIAFANAAAASLFGYTTGELLGQSIDLLVPEAARTRHAQDRQQYLDHAAPRPMGKGQEITGRRKDGSLFPVEVVLNPMGRQTGTMVVAFVSDLTERRAAEREIRAYQEKLKRMAFDAAVAEERERRQIAVNLHDQIGQSLALARIKLSSARDAVPSALRSTIDQCVELLAESLTATRTLTFDLSPPILYDLGLKEALSWLAEDIQRRYGIAVELQVDESPTPLDDASAALVFRAVRELLLNVFKHAKSPAAQVTVGGHEQDLQIAVEDRGVGFDTSAMGHMNAGFGLFSVREQIQRLGGSVEIQSVPREGTRVTLKVPFRPPGNEPTIAEASS